MGKIQTGLLLKESAEIMTLQRLAQTWAAQECLDQQSCNLDQLRLGQPSPGGSVHRVPPVEELEQKKLGGM